MRSTSNSKPALYPTWKEDCYEVQTWLAPGITEDYKLSAALSEKQIEYVVSLIFSDKSDPTVNIQDLLSFLEKSNDADKNFIAELLTEARTWHENNVAGFTMGSGTSYQQENWNRLLAAAVSEYVKQSAPASASAPPPADPPPNPSAKKTAEQTSAIKASLSTVSKEQCPLTRLQEALEILYPFISVDAVTHTTSNFSGESIYRVALNVPRHDVSGAAESRCQRRSRPVLSRTTPKTRDFQRSP